MSRSKKKFGCWGETLAATYLAERGYTILDRNVRTPYGELDLVTLWNPPLEDNREAVLVFIEVKTRSSNAFGWPEEAITPKKQQRLLAAAQAYIQAHLDLPPNWRVDVVAIQYLALGDPPLITHFENAISGSL